MPLPTDAPRRSSRRPKPKQNSSYSVGDVVEISRNNIVAEGRLVYKLSEGPTPNPRWLVSFDGLSWKDEELYERSFGKILLKSDEAEPAPKTANVRKGLRGRGNNNSKTSTNRTTGSNRSSGPSSGEDDESGSKKKKKAVALSGNSIAGSEESSPPSTRSDGAVSGKVSAREQRSRRRQAMTQEDVAELDDGKKRGRPGSAMSRNGSNSNSKPNKRARKNEEVVKIPMLTGTLYLYRGLYRRAEFVRRY